MRSNSQVMKKDDIDRRHAMEDAVQFSRVAVVTNYNISEKAEVALAAARAFAALSLIHI